MKISTSKFGSSLGEYEIDTAKLSEAQIAWAIQNGLRQAATDSHASDTEVEHGSKEKAIHEAMASFKAWVEKIQAGHVPSAGIGRARIAPEVKVLRDVVADWLKASGMKATVAAKMVTTEPCEEIVLRLAIDKAQKTGGDANAMFEKRWSVIQETVQKILAAKAPQVDEEF